MTYIEKNMEGYRMKKLLFGILILVMLLNVAAILPPQMPSSFYGEISGYTSGRVCAYSGGIQRVCTIPFRYSGKWVYTLNVPTDGLTESSIVRFYIKGLRVGLGFIHTGTNVNLNLKVR